MESLFSDIGIVVAENGGDIVRMNCRKRERVSGGASGTGVEVHGNGLEDLVVDLAVVRIQSVHLVVWRSLPSTEDCFLELIGEIGMVIGSCGEETGWLIACCS